MRNRLAAWGVVVAVVAALGVSSSGCGLSSADADKPAKASKVTKSKKLKKAKKAKKKLKKLAREKCATTTNADLEKYIGKLANDFEGATGRWSFEYEKAQMLVITDERADRMRIIAPIIETKDLSKDDLMTLLEANFDRALDAKYTVFENAVWATFVHPLSTLTRQDFISAVKQVAALRNTYGSTYSSMDIVFGGGGAGSGSGDGE